ncbi:MAG: zinc-ribbon domain-containing protein [Candidatus Kariarchaeaceae archaeon]|jgi:uncharacterized membrane protein YvbJ
MVNFCPDCGEKAIENKPFCPSCGAPLGKGAQYSQSQQTMGLQLASRNAHIAIALGILSFFCGGLTSVIGLVFAYKGKREGEDPDTVRTALLLNWIVFGIIIVAAIVLLFVFAL